MNMIGHLEVNNRVTSQIVYSITVQAQYFSISKCMSSERGLD